MKRACGSNNWAKAFHFFKEIPAPSLIEIQIIKFCSKNSSIPARPTFKARSKN